MATPIRHRLAGQRHYRRTPMAYSALSVTAVLSGCTPVVDSFVPLGSVRASGSRRSERARQLQVLHPEQGTFASSGPLSVRNLFKRTPFANSDLEETIASSETNGREQNSLQNILGTSFNQQKPTPNGTNGVDEKGMASPLVFLKRDVSPPVVDDEWAFSLEETVSGATETESITFAQIAVMGLVVTGLVVTATIVGSGIIADFSLPSPEVAVTSIQNFFSNPTATLEAVVQNVEEMGTSGLLYFGIVYTVAEILAIPAIPLTASAGYLFGVTEGTAVVLVSASIAAAVSFVIGRTLLRSYVESVLDEYPRFKKIDKAIGREGFKIMALLRLSPIFPFALSNYLYGATSVGFWPYFFGTMIGFTPGTIAYVYTGEIGKALTIDSATASPWYVYAGGLALLAGFVKVVADVATGIIDDLDDED